MPPVHSKSLADVLPRPSGAKRKHKVLGCKSRPNPARRGPKVPVPRRTYDSPASLQLRSEAADMVKRGVMSYREAEKQFGIAKTVLRNWNTGRAGKGRTGPAPTFTKKEEEELVNFIVLMAEQRFPIDWETVRRVAGEIVARSSNPHRFPNGAPSEYPTSPNCHPLSPSVTLCHTLSHSVTLCHTLSPSVTLCHSLSHSVTLCHTLSHSVTLCHSLSHSVTLCHSLSLFSCWMARWLQEASSQPRSEDPHAGPPGDGNGYRAGCQEMVHRHVAFHRK